MLNNVISIFGTGAAAAVGDYESIATVSVGSGGSANIEFTSIPSTYTHLQIRGILRSTTAVAGTDDLWITVNSDTGNNYAYHLLEGDGATATAGGASTQAKIVIGNSIPRANATASVFGAIVIDLIDYKNTNKYKTFRILNGSNNNDTSTAFRVGFKSGLWQNTNAITTIKLAPEANNFAQYSHFALYGVKG